MEKIKSVPVPIWIGLGLILIVIFVLNSKGGSKQQQNVSAPVGPVTTATVGTQGAQAGAGTDQEIANLSVITQSGFAQIAQQHADMAKQIAGNMGGAGPAMQQVGTGIQATQNGSAQTNAVNGTAGQNAGNNPQPVPTA